MNFVDALRLRRFSGFQDPFGQNIRERVDLSKVPLPKPKPTIKPEMVNPLTPPDSSYSGQLNELYGRPQPRMKEFESYLQTEPRKENYQLNKIGKILAAVAGGAEGWEKGPTTGINTYFGLTERPYAQAREQWQSKGERLRDLATLERQGLTDAEKRIVQGMEFELKKDENERQWLELESGLDLKANQIANVQSLIKHRGLQVVDDKITGRKFVIDPTRPEWREDLGKYAESITDQAAREQGTWEERETISQRNRIDLQSRLFGQQNSLERLRTANDADLARLRSTLSREENDIKNKLEGMSPAAQRAAWSTAWEQAANDKPDLAANRENDPDSFMKEVRLRLSRIRTRATTPGVPTIVGRTVDVIAPDGTEGTIDAGELDQALREGYKRK